MTVDELIQAVHARGWQASLRMPGRTGQDGADNLYVVDRDAEGWYIGFLERGETVVLERCSDEEEAAVTAWKLLGRAHRGAPAGPTDPSAAELPATPDDHGWVTWTPGDCA